MEHGEQAMDALLRELSEEMGFVPEIEKIYPFDLYQSKDSHFKYYSFVSIVTDEFVPILNHESCGYCWIDLGEWPKPMHRGAYVSLCNNRAISRINQLIAQHLLIHNNC